MANEKQTITKVTVDGNVLKSAKAAYGRRLNEPEKALSDFLIIGKALSHANESVNYHSASYKEWLNENFKDMSPDYSSGCQRLFRNEARIKEIKKTSPVKGNNPRTILKWFADALPEGELPLTYKGEVAKPKAPKKAKESPESKSSQTVVVNEPDRITVEASFGRLESAVLMFEKVQKGLGAEHLEKLLALITRLDNVADNASATVEEKRAA